jgi:hypothetical protein
MSCFKAWFVVGILRFQKWFDVDVLNFQIKLCCRYYGFFSLATVLAFFSPKFGQFLPQSSGHSEQGKIVKTQTQIAALNLTCKCVLKCENLFQGKCRCGQCECNENFEGKYCQKSTLVSMPHNSRLCH